MKDGAPDWNKIKQSETDRKIPTQLGDMALQGDSEIIINGTPGSSLDGRPTDKAALPDMGVQASTLHIMRIKLG